MQLFQNFVPFKLIFDNARRRANGESTRTRSTIIVAWLGNAKVLIYHTLAKACRMNYLFYSRQVMAILCSSFNATFWVELPKSCRVTSSNIADTLSVTIVSTFITFIPTCIRGIFENLVNQYLRNKLIDVFVSLIQWEFCVRPLHINQKDGVMVAGSLSPLCPAFI